MSRAVFHVGDTVEVVRSLPANSVDLVLTSPPFLALRSYLPADHPNKHKEIGSEPTPAEFIDTMLALVAEWDRVLAPHGSIAVELGDTYAGSGGAGGDYNDGGLREGQNAFKGSARKYVADGWPLSKSLCGIPQLFEIALAYGINPLTGAESPAGMWRVRNMVAWCRPNPAVGALGDKYRPATSYMTIATRATDRYFDLDAVRVPASQNTNARTAKGVERRDNTCKTSPDGNRDTLAIEHSHATRPPYDHVGLMDGEADLFLEDGWLVSTESYSGSHYATWPRKLLDRPILSMCPQKVCTVCGEPSRRIAVTTNSIPHTSERRDKQERRANYDATNSWAKAAGGHCSIRETVGWSDCGHDSWRRGVVLDPFGGSGTTGAVAAHHGRDAILIDLDERNVDLARERIGMFLTEGWPAGLGDHTPRDEHWCADHCPDCNKEEP